MPGFLPKGEEIRRASVRWRSRAGCRSVRVLTGLDGNAWHVGQGHGPPAVGGEGIASE